MGSPLGPVLANILTVELKRNVTPALWNDISLWNRYVDHTICFISLTFINKVLETLISYNKSVKITIEVERENKILFLNVLVIRNYSLISSKVYCKNTNTDIYKNQKPFASNSWKWRTLKTLVNRASSICLIDKYLVLSDLEQIGTVFHHRNNYSLWVLTKLFMMLRSLQQQMNMILVEIMKFTI